MGAGNTLLSGNLNNGAAGSDQDGRRPAHPHGRERQRLHAGPVTVAGGTLLLDNGNGSTTHYNSANFNINGPSTLTFKSSAGAGSRNDLNARTFTFDATGGGTVNTTGPINWVVSNNTFVTNGGATDTLATSINLNSGSITFNTAVRGTGLVDLDVTAALGNSGAAVTKNGPGILRFAGSNSFAGALAINAGTLIIASSTALGTSASATTVAAGAMLDLNGQSAGAEALTLNGTGILSAGALINSSAVAAGLNGNVTMATASSIGGSGDITLGGVVSGPGLEKVGAGTLTLSNANTFTGAATVSQGALLINGTTPAAGLINVSASATLGGGGSGGVATLADGAVLSPGNADGNTGNLFILAGLSMAADSVFRFEPGTPSNSYYTDPGSSYFTDHVTVNEALTLNGRILVAYPAGSLVLRPEHRRRGRPLAGGELHRRPDRQHPRDRPRLRPPGPGAGLPGQHHLQPRLCVRRGGRARGGQRRAAGAGPRGLLRRRFR
ncbi:MAG: autotransporter-associated beta strand repeat-containing protein [Kiritimatiellia bacterium]